METIIIVVDATILVVQILLKLILPFILLRSMNVPIKHWRNWRWLQNVWTGANVWSHYYYHYDLNKNVIIDHTVCFMLFGNVSDRCCLNFSVRPPLISTFWLDMLGYVLKFLVLSLLRSTLIKQTYDERHCNWDQPVVLGIFMTTLSNVSYLYLRLFDRCNLMEIWLLFLFLSGYVTI